MWGVIGVRRNRRLVSGALVLGVVCALTAPSAASGALVFSGGVLLTQP